MKKYLLYTLFIFLLVGLVFTYRPSPRTITTDSGWDSSYDSGGGSDWSSSDSSWDSDYGSSSGGSSKSLDEMTLSDFVLAEVFFSILYGCFIYILLINFFKEGTSTVIYTIFISVARALIAIILETTILPQIYYLSIIGMFITPFFLAKSADKGIKYKESKRIKEEYKECSDEELSKVGINNKEELKNELYKIFVDVQNAWMEFDYDALAKLCSDELYNSYKRDLEVLKLKNGKNIMNSFNKKNIVIISAKNINEVISIKVLLQVEFNDYVINTQTNKVIRGNKNTKMNNSYILNYTKNNTHLDKCPSCGAKLEESSNTKCPHCGNTITNNTDNYVLAHKERI